MKFRLCATTTSKRIWFSSCCCFSPENNNTKINSQSKCQKIVKFHSALSKVATCSNLICRSHWDPSLFFCQIGKPLFDGDNLCFIVQEHWNHGMLPMQHTNHEAGKSHTKSMQITQSCSLLKSHCKSHWDASLFFKFESHCLMEMILILAFHCSGTLKQWHVNAACQSWGRKIKQKECQCEQQWSKICFIQCGNGEPIWLFVGQVKFSNVSTF